MSKKFWAAFNSVGGVGPVAIRRLLERFGDLELAWRANTSELGAAGIDRATAAAVVQQRSKIDPDGIMERLSQLGGHLIVASDPDYPRRLREIDDSPPVLYVLGEITPADEWAVAIVGTRQATAYGLQVTEKLSGDLARSQVTIVSGLALGVDGRAHRTAIEAGGRTIAVLGSGVDQIYPQEHRRLAEAIIRQGLGAVVSEYPLGTPPLAKNFPYRNRVIAGLCLGVVIVEGDVTSGARFTADFAGEQGREVFAVPGNIFSARSALPHRLLQDGAKLVTGAADILSELNLALIPQQMEMREVLPADPTEEALLAVLSHEPMHIDEIVRAANMPTAVVSSNLTMMELKGMVRRAGSMSFTVAN